MFDKLDVFQNRYEELNGKLSDPSVLSDPAKYAALMKEHSSLSPIVEAYGALKQARSSAEEARRLLDEPGLDKELRQMAEEELEEARERQERLTEEIKILLLPKDPNDEKNVIVEIRGGAGGEEAALFSSVLFRMYTMYAERMGWGCLLYTSRCV